MNAYFQPAEPAVVDLLRNKMFPFFCQAVISAPAKGNPVSLGSQKVSTGKLKLSVRRLKLKFIHLVFAAVRCGDRRRVVIASTREETC